MLISPSRTRLRPDPFKRQQIAGASRRAEIVVQDAAGTQTQIAGFRQRANRAGSAAARRQVAASQTEVPGVRARAAERAAGKGDRTIHRRRRILKQRAAGQRDAAGGVDASRPAEG